MARFSLPANQGFTLLEVLIATGIIMTAMVGIFGLAIQSLKAAEASRNFFVAANLAQEGVEIVRSARDSNWLAYPDDNSHWLDGLLGTYRVQSFGPSGGAVILANSTAPLKIGPAGYYNYDTGTDTIFSRTIEVNDLGGDQASVKSTLVWTGAGNLQRTLEVMDKLTNWR